MPPLGFEPSPKRLKVSCANRWHYGGVLLKDTTPRDVCQVDLNGIEPMTSWMQIRRSPSWATGPYLIFETYAPGETRTRKVVRPADFKSAVYTIPPQEQLLWMKNPPRRKGGHYLLYLILSSSIRVCLFIWHASHRKLPLCRYDGISTTRSHKERGSETHPTPDRFVTTSLHFPINILKINPSLSIVKSHLNI